jgi:hypothetical protein
MPEIGICRQHGEVMAQAKQGQQGIDCPELHTVAAPRVGRRE